MLDDGRDDGHQVGLELVRSLYKEEENMAVPLESDISIRSNTLKDASKSWHLLEHTSRPLRSLRSERESVFP